MHQIQWILLRDRLKFQFDWSKINVSGEKVSKIIDRTMYPLLYSTLLYSTLPNFNAIAPRINE